MKSLTSPLVFTAAISLSAAAILTGCSNASGGEQSSVTVKQYQPGPSSMCQTVQRQVDTAVGALAKAGDDPVKEDQVLIVFAQGLQEDSTTDQVTEQDFTRYMSDVLGLKSAVETYEADVQNGLSVMYVGDRLAVAQLAVDANVDEKPLAADCGFTAGTNGAVK